MKIQFFAKWRNNYKLYREVYPTITKKVAILRGFNLTRTQSRWSTYWDETELKKLERDLTAYYSDRFKKELENEGSLLNS